MTDLENLSKKELLALLKAQKTSKALDSAPCKFTGAKGKIECVEPSSTPYGFCKKHVRTVQAKKAKEEYDASLTVKEIPKEEAPKKSKEGIITETPKKPKKEVITETPKKPKKEPIVEAPIKKPIKNKEETPIKKSQKSIKKEGPHIKSSKNVSKKVAAVRQKTILPNVWGNYEDTESNIVFNAKTIEAIGVQEKNGTVSALKPEHVAICARNGWNYILPYSNEESDDDPAESSSEEESDDNDTDDEEEIVSKGGDASSESSEEDEEEDDEEEDDDDEDGSADEEDDDDDEVFGSSSSS